MRALNTLFFLAFALSVLVQYNDPDLWRWIVFYALAAANCVAFHYRKLHWQASAALGLTAVAWCLYLLPQFMGQVSLQEVVASLRMQTTAVEEAREAGGTFIVALWMTALSRYLWRRRSSHSL